MPISTALLCNNVLCLSLSLPHPPSCSYTCLICWAFSWADTSSPRSAKSSAFLLTLSSFFKTHFFLALASVILIFDRPTIYLFLLSMVDFHHLLRDRQSLLIVLGLVTVVSQEPIGEIVIVMHPLILPTLDQVLMLLFDCTMNASIASGSDYRDNVIVCDAPYKQLFNINIIVF